MYTMPQSRRNRESTPPQQVLASVLLARRELTWQVIWLDRTNQLDLLALGVALAMYVVVYVASPEGARAAVVARSCATAAPVF